MTEALAQEDPVTDSQEEIHLITEVGELIFCLEEWHGEQIATLHHLMDIPEGTEVTEEGMPPITLSGEALRAFRMGIITSLNYLGKLPFSPVPEDGVVH